MGSIRHNSQGQLLPDLEAYREGVFLGWAIVQLGLTSLTLVLEKSYCIAKRISDEHSIRHTHWNLPPKT